MKDLMMIRRLELTKRLASSSSGIVMHLEPGSRNIIILQNNGIDEKDSNANNMMTVRAFSNIYFDGAPIFDEKCQNAGLGPWNLIKADWKGYAKRWGCHW